MFCSQWNQLLYFNCTTRGSNLSKEAMLLTRIFHLNTLIIGISDIDGDDEGIVALKSDCFGYGMHCCLSSMIVDPAVVAWIILLRRTFQNIDRLSAEMFLTCSQISGVIPSNSTLRSSGLNNEVMRIISASITMNPIYQHEADELYDLYQAPAITQDINESNSERRTSAESIVSLHAAAAAAGDDDDDDDVRQEELTTAAAGGSSALSFYSSLLQTLVKTFRKQSRILPWTSKD